MAGSIPSPPTAAVPNSSTTTAAGPCNTSSASCRQQQQSSSSKHAPAAAHQPHHCKGVCGPVGAAGHRRARAASCGRIQQRHSSPLAGDTQVRLAGPPGSKWCAHAFCTATAQGIACVDCLSNTKLLCGNYAGAARNPHARAQLAPAASQVPALSLQLLAAVTQQLTLARAVVHIVYHQRQLKRKHCSIQCSQLSKLREQQQ